MAARIFNGASAACAVAAVSLVASMAAAFALALPATDFSRAFGLAGSSEALADTLVRTAATDVGARDAAVAASRRTLTQAPASATAWLRLAYLDSLSPAGLGPQGNRALTASYIAAPYGPDDTVWRLTFSLNHWRDLEKSNRELALAELRHFDQARPRLVRQVRSGVVDDVGMLALSLTAPAPSR